MENDWPEEERPDDGWQQQEEAEVVGALSEILEKVVVALRPDELNMLRWACGMGAEPQQGNAQQMDIYGEWHAS